MRTAIYPLRMPNSTSTLNQLHQSGTFLLVNIHDAGSAALAQAAGAQALGTTSGGHAYTIGRPDAAGAVTRDEVLQRVSEICAVVDIPLSVDAENGWGHSPEEVAESIRCLVEVGAAGASIEDWSGSADIGFYEHGLAVERVVAAVEAARSLDPDFVICARADRMMHDGEAVFADVLGRLQSFSTAGADCVYAPGTADTELIGTLVNEAGGPINALLGVGGKLTVTEMERLGVRRVSLGSSLYQATMALFDRIVRQAISTGSLEVDIAPLEWESIESLYPASG